ncbi:MAG: CooT family nickel-binding protein [Deltaproteobacteria bacterium]|jgi:predicted RNA-binding protein|nr:CooT family nickel-binding protein [Deltaproteobacteria bacterium]
MCEANVYITKNGDEELFLSSVDEVLPEGNGTWKLTSIFGEQKIINGKIASMHLVDHRIVFETTDPN